MLPNQSIDQKNWKCSKVRSRGTAGFLLVLASILPPEQQPTVGRKTGCLTGLAMLSWHHWHQMAKWPLPGCHLLNDFWMTCVGEEDKVVSGTTPWLGPSDKNHNGERLNTRIRVRTHDGWNSLHVLSGTNLFNKVCYLSVCRLLKRIFLTQILSQITI